MFPFVRQWTEQPPSIRGPAEDWADRGLVALFDVRNAVEVFSGAVATNRTALLAPSVGGDAADFSGTANQQYAHRAAYAQTGAFSLLILCDVDALTNFGALIAKNGTTTTNTPYELRLGNGATDSRISITRCDASTFGNANGSAGNLIAAGSRFVRLIVTSNTADRSPSGDVWVNGVKTSYTTTASGSAATDSGATVWIGRRFDGATQLDGRIFHIGLMNRAANDADAFAFFDNPFGVFESRRILVPVSAGGGAVPVLSIPEGISITSSGFTPRVTYTY